MIQLVIEVCVILLVSYGTLSNTVGDGSLCDIVDE